MSSREEGGNPPIRARKEPVGDVRPQSAAERQESLSLYLLHRAQHRRELFHRRASAFSLRKELARNLYLAGCLVFDLVVIPDAIFLLPSPWGWLVTVAGVAVAVLLEYRFYRAHFSLPSEQE